MNNYRILAMSLALALPALAQVKTEVPPVVPGAKPVAVEHIKVHGRALEGNLENDAVDREVIVFLPPSYATEKSRRYPVVYALHGYSIGAAQWSQEIHVPQTIEGAFAQGAQEMIVVLPDSKTVHNGSMYSSSVTTGDFEQFIAHDLVAYIDAHYRTIPKRSLAGHSMGGEPQYVQALTYLGDAELRLESDASAEDHLQNALKLAPDTRLAHLDLGILLARRNEPDEAVRHFRDAIRIDPSRSDAYYRLARLLNSLGREQEAQSEFERVKRLAAEESPVPLLRVPGPADSLMQGGIGRYCLSLGGLKPSPFKRRL